MPRTVTEGFEELIRRLQPLSSEHETAAKHKSTVFSCLQKNFDCYELKETGSFGNGTGVRQYSDTDYFAICKANTLPDNSKYTLGRFREELQYTFHKTDGIKVNTPAVQIPFGYHSSETLEVTPTYFHGMIDTPVGKKPFYSIPNYLAGWMKSSPDTHNAYVRQEDQRLNKKLKPLIQLVKAWKYYNEAEIISFYLELRITKYAETEKDIDYAIDFKRILNLLLNNELADMNDPMGISGRVPSTKTIAQKETAFSKIKNDLARAEKAIEAANKGNIDEAFRLWDMIFCNKFPSR